MMGEKGFVMVVVVIPGNGCFPDNEASVMLQK